MRERRKRRRTVLEVEQIMIRLRELIMGITKRVGAVPEGRVADDVERNFAHCARTNER